MQTVLLVLFIRVLAAVVGFFTIAAITRSISQEDVGAYFYVISLSAIFTALVSLGLNNVVLRKSSLVDAQHGKIVSTACCLILASSFVGIPAFYLVLSYQGFNDITIFAIVSSVMALSAVLSHSLQGMGWVKTAVFLGGTLHQFLFFSLILLFQPSELKSLIEVFLLTYVITFLATLIFWIRKNNSPIELQKELSSFLTPALPLMIYQFSQEMNLAIGQQILGYFKYLDELAAFGVCMKIATIIAFIGFALNRVYAPNFARTFEENNLDELNAVILDSRNKALLLGIPVILVGLFFSEFIMSLFGKDYVQYAWLMQSVLSIQVVALINGKIAYVVLMIGEEKYYRNVIVFSSLIAYLIAFIIVGASPLIGVFVGYALGVSLPLISSLLFLKKKTGLNYFEGIG